MNRIRFTCPRGVPLCGCNGRNPDHVPETDAPELPEPEVRARLVVGSRLPGGAALLAKRARQAGGWFVWAMYARGTRDTRTRPLIESVALKGRCPEKREAFVVVYARPVGGKWTAASAWVGKAGRLEMTSVAEVKALVSGGVSSSKALVGVPLKPSDRQEMRTP